MVERNEIQQMSKFMAALGGTRSDDGSPTAPALTDPSIQAMKSILETFHACTDNVLAEAEIDGELREALVTEEIAEGARIGLWEIHSRISGKRRLYDILYQDTGERLAADLMLYEVARRLVKILNEGGHINQRDAVELLRVEQDYAGSIHDMVLFRHRLTKQPTSPRAAIFEARYGDAKRRAIRARERAEMLCNGSHRR